MDYMEFISPDNEFTRRFATNMDARWVTFKAALNLLARPASRCKRSLIIETGCARQVNDWGGGQSTLVLREFMKLFPSCFLWSVDINPNSLDQCRKVLGDDPVNERVELVECDSVKFLSEFPFRLDLLYLDSFDYPWGELIQTHAQATGKSTTDAEADLWSMSHEEVATLHWPVIQDCQEHCLKELQAAIDSGAIDDSTIILIDDNMLPGGGKPRLAKKFLHEELDWECVYDYQQTLWIK